MTGDQLDAVVAATGIERYRWLASDDNPDEARRESYRRLVERLAAEPGETPEHPSLTTQAGNLAGAAVRFVASGFATVDREEYERRRAICRACPTNQFDAEADRCFRCGCALAVKPWSKAERCPDGHWSRA